tara:strand:- start:21 stop:1181 length:1161 start_codon:yes stop_codon:yes gene_type:complete
MGKDIKNFLDYEKYTSKFFSNYKRIIIKVGSSLIINKKTRTIRNNWLSAFSEDIAYLQKIKKEIIIVSSGAIALGRNTLISSDKTLNLEENQAAASIGQIELAYSWKAALEHQNIKCAQILLSPDDTETRRRHLNARATIATLINSHVVPVINENDTVTTSEIKFGDNDRLAARVAQMASSDLLILLSDIDGLYDQNPHHSKTAKHIPLVAEINEEIMNMAGSSHYEYASGGMVTKLEAAKISSLSGCNLIICNGESEHPILELSKGKKHTIFKANETPLTARKKWIAAGLNILGKLIVDNGASTALKNGSSLLPAGVIKVEGLFEKGDLVEILDQDRRNIGSGLSSYNSREIEIISGKKTRDIKSYLGYEGRDELIHRDDLVLKK